MCGFLEIPMMFSRHFPTEVAFQESPLYFLGMSQDVFQESPLPFPGISFAFCFFIFPACFPGISWFSSKEYLSMISRNSHITFHDFLSFFLGISTLLARNCPFSF